MENELSYYNSDKETMFKVQPLFMKLLLVQMGIL